MMPTFGDWPLHVLVGIAAATGGVLGHRAWIRRRWSRPPAGVVDEAVVALDLVDSTKLTTHYGDRLAMQATNFLRQIALGAARSCGATHSRINGDGCMMTFPSVLAATQAASKVMQQLRRPPQELSSMPPLEVRAGIAYGVILLDAEGHRHGATINRAFRLMAVSSDAFVDVAGEPRLEKFPDRGRLFVDEASAQELRPGKVMLREVGVCTLKGFTGFHRAFELRDADMNHLATEVR